MQTKLHEALVGTWHATSLRNNIASAVDTEYFPDNSFKSYGAVAFRSPDDHGGEDILCEEFTIEGRWDVDGTRLTENVESVQLSGLYVYPETPIREAEMSDERRARMMAQEDLIEMAMSTVESADIVNVEPDCITFSDGKGGREWCVTRIDEPNLIILHLDAILAINRRGS